MRLSNSFFITRREVPKDEVNISSKLLVKSGMIMKLENGIYSYLPFGFMVLENIKTIIKEELNKINAHELLTPTLVNSEVFEKTGRDKLLNNEIFKIENRYNKLYSLCPTSEEIFTSLAKYKINSYKDLHFTLYQINNKYRDEQKVELGLCRKKEFLMADAYSFDANEAGCDVSYDKIYQAYIKIFDRIGLSPMIVRSDPYYMMGLSSEEFQVISDYGDNLVVKCNSCDYASNIEDANCKNIIKEKNEKIENMSLIRTTNIKTINEICEYLQIDPNDIIKSLVIKADDEYKMLLLRGNSELNINKLKRLLKTENITIPDSLELEKIGTHVGFIGPINATMEVIADNEIKSMINAVCGSNKKNYHYINVLPGRDFKVNRYSDIKLFDENSICPKCKSNCSIIKGIEVGHIFKLGTNYSECYDLKYTDEVNNKNLVYMGSYGIGIDRCLCAIVEENHDDKGIIWPMEVSPFKVCIVVANTNDKDCSKYAENLHDKLINLGISVLLDDRKETIGVKFADMDLIGIPIRVTIGKYYENNEVEIKIRNEDETRLIKVENLINEIKYIIENYKKI
ncbi:MAG: proline--tRNA ligase [Bacilli bacterium]